MEVNLKSMDVSIRTMGGTEYSMRIGRMWTGRDFKAHVSKELQIPPQLQIQLLVGTKIIQDAQLMEKWCDSEGPLEITLTRRSHDVAEWLQKVGKNGLCLQDAELSVQSDPEVVLAAISQNGLALQFAAVELRGDRDFISRAVAQNAAALVFAEADMRSDRAFVLNMVRISGCSLAGAEDSLKADPEVVLAAAKENHYALTHAARALKTDRVFIQTLLQHRVAYALRFASAGLQQDEKLRALEAMYIPAY